MLSSLYKKYLLNTSFILSLFFAIEVNADPLLYSGVLIVNKVSGKTCKPDSIGKKHNIELVLEKNDTGYSGFFGDKYGDITTGKLAGSSFENLSVKYSYVEKELSDGHSLTLYEEGSELKGVLREVHFEETYNGCSSDEATLSLKKVSTDKSGWERLSSQFEAESLSLLGNKLALEGKVSEAIPRFEKSLKISEMILVSNDKQIETIKIIASSGEFGLVVD